MSTNAVERTAEEAKAAAHSVAEAATQIASQAERSFAEAAKRFEKVVAEGMGCLSGPAGKVMPRRRSSSSWPWPSRSMPPSCPS